MGFSSWNAFKGENNEIKMKETAEAIVRLGLDKVGYTYLTVDDFWNVPSRDKNGRLQVNAERFLLSLK